MRHQLVAVLGVAVCAVLAGARCYVAIAEWAHDLPAAVRVRLGIKRVPPSESAIRRVLQAIDSHLLDRTVCGWLAARARGCERWRAVAVDGKTARGARQADGRAVHLLAALDHADGVVLRRGRLRPRRSMRVCLVRDSLAIVVKRSAIHRRTIVRLTGKTSEIGTNGATMRPRFQLTALD